MRPSPPVTHRHLPDSAGFSLVELLLACALGAVILAASWSWLFTLVADGGRDTRRLETQTSLAFAERLATAELRRAVALSASPAPGCSSSSVAFIVAKSDMTTETISYVWNPATHVLWRKAAGSHLADAVADFSVHYLDAVGSEVTSAGGSLSSAELARVRSLRLALTLVSGSERVTAAWDVTPRAAR